MGLLLKIMCDMAVRNVKASQNGDPRNGYGQQFCEESENKEVLGLNVCDSGSNSDASESVMFMII